MHEADRVYLSKFLVDSDSGRSSLDEPTLSLDHKALFQEDGGLDDLSFDNWFDMD